MNLNSLYVLIFLFLNLNVFGQKPLTSEDKIYNAIDLFIANPTVDGLQNLNKVEINFWKKPKPKSKNELIAIVVLNCNKAFYENQFNQTQVAVSCYEKAWKTFQKYKLSNYDIIEYCLKPLGNLYTILGDYDNAENTIKHYYYLANSANNSPEASGQKIAAILNLSNVYQSAGKTNEAIDLLEKTIKTEKLSNTQKGILLNNLGNNYMLSSKGDLINPEAFTKAEKCFLKAITLLEKEKNQAETLSNCYLNLATFNSLWKNFDKANDYFTKAKKLFFESKNLEPRKVAKLFYEEALLLFEQQNGSQAKIAIGNVFKTLIPNYNPKNGILPTQKYLYAETLLLDALDLQAEIFNNEKQSKKAIEAYNQSFYVEDLLATLLVYENAKIISQTRFRNRIEKCIAIYYSLFQKEHKQSYIENAFQLAEKTKSGVLKSYLLKNETATREEKLHIEQLQNWANIILKEQQKGNNAAISIINEAIENQNELMLSLKKIQSKDSKISKSEINLNDLFAKLEKDNAILINYFSGSNSLYYFVIENKKITLHSLSNDSHSIVKIWQFINYFKDSDAILNDLKGYNHHGKVAYDFLKLPKNTTYKNLIIIPDGLLNFLSFEALITKESSTTNFAKMHYLANDYAIGYNNSVSFYLSEETQKQSRKNVLGIFPVFEKTDYVLTYSKKEMEAIKTNFEGTYIENKDATFDNFKKNAANYSIIHLSTHADSGDTETSSSIKFYDQEILYSELYNLNINPDLVVLSACETGIGKLYKSEGAMSIARGFQFAGARNLLFSLWKVNDFTTSVFMDYFYRYCQKGESFFEANHQAKLDFLKNKTIPNAKKSPYYWSAFVYYGGIDSGKESFNYTYVILGFIILISLFLILIRIRKWKKYKKS